MEGGRERGRGKKDVEFSFRRWACLTGVRT